MPWIRFDDTFPEHPKVLEVGPRAAWLHVRAIGYCSRLLTDGVLTDRAAKECGATPSLIVALVDAKLWERRAGFYLIHDYLKYQPSRAQILEQREMKAQAGRAGGLRSHGKQEASR